MKLFSTQQIRDWDQYTIANEPISSLDLMERAATRIFEYFIEHIGISSPYYIVCGPGNNGGDGLVLARKLVKVGAKVHCFVPRFTEKYSKDFKTNLDRLGELMEVNSFQDFNQLGVPPNSFVVDAVFGSGLDRVIHGDFLSTVNKINELVDVKVFSIDIPSGLFGEKVNLDKGIVKADYTITLQKPKLSFFFPESHVYIGSVEVLDIGLSKSYEEETVSNYELVSSENFPAIEKREKFAHKGTYGHTLLVGGNTGMSGAIQMSCEAALRGGAGLVSVMSNEKTEQYIQSNCPQAMFQEVDFENPNISIEITKFSSMAIGPGLGVSKGTKILLQNLVEHYKGRLVLDADALNILASDESLFFSLPKNTVLTPHPGEFKRLFGDYITQEEAWEKQVYYAKHYHLYIVLKGAYSTMATPEGKLFINTSGNPVLAKGGSGDMLTGMIASLLAWNDDVAKVLKQAIFIHGRTGEQIEKEYGGVAGNAKDFLKYLPCVFAEHSEK